MEASEAAKPAVPEVRKRTHWTLFLVLAVCAAPMVLSYFTYYVIKPESRTNYGALVDPRAHPIPELGTTALDGSAAALSDYAGKWIMLQADVAACPKPCTDKLLWQRQVRLTQGKDMERIERVWLVTDDAPLETVLMKEYDGTHILRVDREKLAAWLPAAEGADITDHIYLIDPLGNLMMRFPKDPDPNKIKRDVGKLLRASRIG